MPINKYTATLLFYVVAIGVVAILLKVSPNAHDGGLGFGGLAIILLAIIIIGLICFNIYKGFKVDKGYFVIAAIHTVVLLIYGSRFFR